jgi:8-oxo-dGTP pyrophosphatase MutT (NUDIX family)
MHRSKELFMPSLATTALEPATSCGTLVINNRREILLCHVTGTHHWDIPKGMQDPGESTIEAAIRELREETGLVLDQALFQEIGSFDYQRHKRLHLYTVRAPQSLDKLDHLVCTSHFIHHQTGKPTPEMDGFRWASCHEIRALCAPRMAERLLSLNW